MPQTGFHSLQIHLGAIALWVVRGTLAPAVIVPAHKQAFLVTADVSESSLHKASSQILRENNLETCSMEGEYGNNEYLCEICGNHWRSGGFFKTQHMFSVILDMLGFAYGFIYTALFHHSCCKSLLGCTSALCRHPWKKRRRVIEAKFILTLRCCSYKLAREQTL